MRHLSIRAARVKSLVYSIYDGLFYSCMVGFGETYISAYALFLGADNFQMGILTSLPPFLAGLAQFFTLPLNRRFKSRKKLVCTGVFSQVLTFIPLVAAYFLHTLRIEFYIIVVTLYFASNAVIGPVWNSWMGDLVGASQRGIYFGRRNRVITLGTFVSMTAAGFLLRYFADKSSELTGFYVIFALAFTSRIWSFYFLSLKYDPPSHGVVAGPSGFWPFVRELPRQNHGILILYMALVNFAVFISAAFFTPLMLRTLHFSYATYTLVIGGAALMKFVASSFWGELCDKLGARQTLLFSGFFICFTTLPWVFSGDPVVLFISQCLTGLVWSGYELSTFTFLLDATLPEERTRISSYLNIITAASGLLGGLLGAVLTSGTLNLPHPFATVFVLGAFIRILAFLFVGRKLKEVRVLSPVKAKDVLIKATGFKSAMGLTSRLVVFSKRQKWPKLPG